MREIVTLQFGERSNYLGTHFWNTQVSTSLLLFVHMLPPLEPLSGLTYAFGSLYRMSGADSYVGWPRTLRFVIVVTSYTQQKTPHQEMRAIFQLLSKDLFHIPLLT